jgi:hypothetical protein
MKQHQKISTTLILSIVTLLIIGTAINAVPSIQQTTFALGASGNSGSVSGPGSPSTSNIHGTPAGNLGVPSTSNITW